jgi:hypothetical protein
LPVSNTKADEKAIDEKVEDEFDTLKNVEAKEKCENGNDITIADTDNANKDDPDNHQANANAYTIDARLLTGLQESWQSLRQMMSMVKEIK